MSRWCVLLCAATLLAASASQAATFTVTNPADTGPGTLRQAILDANANPGLDQIRFAVASQTASPLPDITDILDFDGAVQPPQDAATVFWELPILRFGPGSSGSTLRNAHLGGLFVEAGVSGMTIAGNTIEGLVTIAGDHNLIGGTAPGEGNDCAHASTLTPNFMEVTGDGNEFYRNTFGLMSIEFAQDNRVGSAGNGNVFVGKTTHPHLATGDALSLRSSATVVEGNIIGTGSVLAGIHVIQAEPAAGPSRITGNAVYGGLYGHPAIWVEGPVTGVEILGNPIIVSRIQLTGGANHMQPAPDLTGALWQPGGITVTGTLQGTPHTPHIIELYGSPEPSEWPRYALLTSFEVSTDAAGSAEFTRTLPAAPLDDLFFLIATATNRISHDTSATSSEEIVDAMTTIGFSSASFEVREEDTEIRIPIIRTGGTRQCCFEVSYATVDGTARAGDDYGSVDGWDLFDCSEPAGCEAMAVTIPIVHDGIRESNETFTVVMSVPPSPGVSLGITTATVTILAPADPVPTLSQWALLALTLALTASVLLRLR